MASANSDPENGRIFTLRSEHLDWLNVEDSVVALDGQESVYVSTNPTGAELWQALAEGATRADLAGKLVEAYGIELDQALADVDAFLQMAEEHGLLEAPE